jgi:hypothetical protein
MKFPEAGYSPLDVEAARQTQRRGWKASLARWALPAILITGGLVYAAQSLPNCMQSVLSDIRQAPSVIDTTLPGTADNETWSWCGYKFPFCSGPHTCYSGNDTVKCTNILLGNDVNYVTWSPGDASSEFVFRAFHEPGCVGEPLPLINTTKCYPWVTQSWEVVHFVKF